MEDEARRHLLSLLPTSPKVLATAIIDAVELCSLALTLDLTFIPSHIGVMSVDTRNNHTVTHRSMLKRTAACR